MDQPTASPSARTLSVVDGASAESRVVAARLGTPNVHTNGQLAAPKASAAASTMAGFSQTNTSGVPSARENGCRSVRSVSQTGSPATAHSRAAGPSPTSGRFSANTWVDTPSHITPTAAHASCHAAGSDTGSTYGRPAVAARPAANRATARPSPAPRSSAWASPNILAAKTPNLTGSPGVELVASTPALRGERASRWRITAAICSAR